MDMSSRRIRLDQIVARATPVAPVSQNVPNLIVLSFTLQNALPELLVSLLYPSEGDRHSADTLAAPAAQKFNWPITPMPHVSASRVTVNELVESLGLRVDNQELEGLVHIKTWPAFQPHTVKQLFDILLVDNDTSLERTNPDSFDAELDELLKRWGSKIWPQSEYVKSLLLPS